MTSAPCAVSATRMMTSRIHMQPAYVLHLRPYGDTSALVELFTPQYGRVGVVAKGAKRPKSSYRGILQQFQPLLASWSGRGELATLTGLEPQGQRLQLSAQLLASGFYLNELLMRLLHRHEAQVELFSYYDTCLRELAALSLLDSGREGDAAQNLEVLLRRFEAQLLESLGYGLILDHDVESGEVIEVSRQYWYQPDHGPVRLEGDLPDGGLNDSGVRVSGASLLNLQAGKLSDPQTRREAKHLMRAVLAVHLGPKPLLSRQMLVRESASPETKTNNEEVT